MDAPSIHTNTYTIHQYTRSTISSLPQVSTAALVQKSKMKDDQSDIKSGAACDDKDNQHRVTKEADQYYTKEDLISLIRAIKFSNPDASIRDVHHEIKTRMSKNESFEFLERVELHDVKKVWKKALKGETGAGAGGTNGHPGNNKNTVKNAMNDDKQSMKNDSDDLLTDIKMKAKKDGILKFYTVGDGSVKTLAHNYTMQAAARIVDQEKASKEAHDEEEMKKYVHCFLDVPADCSGGRPQQAIINFNDTSTKNVSDHFSNKGESNGKVKREIVKIQVAAPLPGLVNSPMLLYNADRSAKTFIHDDNDDVNNGYEKIKQMINAHGVSGVLSGGGTKAYFYSVITRRKDEQDLISIDISELAPVQKW